MRQKAKKSEIAYDPELRKTEHGSKLYHYWKGVSKDTDAKEFLSFPGFYAWAMSNGYTIGARLFRRDIRKPHGPDNSHWVSKYAPLPEERQVNREQAWKEMWDETVNRIRLHYGMEPIHSPEV